MTSMSDGRINERVSSLESWREDTNRRLEDVRDDITAINNRIDVVRSNELKHITDRIGVLEKDEGGSISKGDWAKILIAIIGTAGLVLATVIQYVVGR